MFPICLKCKCEMLDPSCGGWTPDTPPHDCLIALKQEKTTILYQLFKLQERIKACKAGKL